MKVRVERRDPQGPRPYGWRWEPGRAGRWVKVGEEQQALALAWALWRGLWQGEDPRPTVPRPMLLDFAERSGFSRPRAEAWLLAGGVPLDEIAEWMGWSKSACYRRLVAYARRIGDSTCLFGSRFGKCVQSTMPFSRRTCARLRCRVCDAADPYRVRLREKQQRRCARKAMAQGMGADQAAQEWLLCYL